MPGDFQAAGDLTVMAFRPKNKAPITLLIAPGHSEAKLE